MDIESFIQYASTSDPGYPDRIIGASPSPIETLEKILYRTAFLASRTRKNPSYITCKARDANQPMGDLIQAADRLGIEAHWFSDGAWHCGEQGGHCLVAIKDPWHPLWVRVSSGDWARTEQTGKSIRQDLDLLVIARSPDWA